MRAKPLFAVSLLTHGEIRSHREARDGSVSDGEQPSQTDTVFPINFSTYLSRPSLLVSESNSAGWERPPHSIHPEIFCSKTSPLSSILGGSAPGLHIALHAAC